MINAANVLFLLSGVLAVVGIFRQSDYVGVNTDEIVPERVDFHRRHRRSYKLFFAFAATSVISLTADIVILQLASATWIAGMAVGLSVVMTCLVTMLLVYSVHDVER